MMYSTLCTFLACILLVQGHPVSNNTEVNDAADSLALALNTFVNAKGNELLDVVDHEVNEVKDNLDDHSAQLRTLEEELQTLSETGSIVGCKGVLHAGYCYFLVNQRYSMDSALLSCQRDESELAQLDHQDELDAIHSYIIHTDQVTDKSTIFVWTAMHADDDNVVLNTTDNWLTGFPVSEYTGNPGIMWQVMSDDFYLYHDGFFTAPNEATAYPLCKKYIAPDINECTEHNGTLPCNNDAVCINTPTSYECQCTAGWSGDTCDLDVDECAADVCGVDSTSCDNTVGSFTCNCNTGYDGETCDNNCELGMQSGNITDSQLSASSVWGDMFSDSGPQTGRLHAFTATNYGAWTANMNLPGGAVVSWTETIGTSTNSASMDVHVNFPGNYAVMPTVATLTVVGEPQYTDLFSAEVINLYTDGMDVRVTRTNGGGWGQTPTLTVVLQDVLNQLSDAEWIQVDFGTPTDVTGVVTQGRGDQDQWVTKFMVYYGDDVNSLQTFTNQDGLPKLFDGNFDRTTLVETTLPTPVTASIIRLYVVNWYQYVSMRFELLNCIPN